MIRLTRRRVLRGLGAVACSAAAHPLTTTVTFADAPGDARLVVIILRGAMDGLDVLRPVGDPDHAALRRHIGAEAGPALDGFFQLHPALAGLHPLWQSGELAFAHAVSTPYRDKRSHFDGQDLLEAGTGMDVAPGTARDGWLNRLLQVIPGSGGETAYAIGTDPMKILDGPALHSIWSQDAALSISTQKQLLLEYLYEEDPLFHAAAAEAIELAALEPGMAGDSAMASPMRNRRRGRAAETLAAFAAGRLAASSRIAAFSITGWDTHKDQSRALGRPLSELAVAVETLRDGLGPAWGQTMVMAMTEFGRTVRENGSKGTDHGTGGAMLLAGGALNGGRVFGRWPGLDEASLYQRRDLMPTADVRAYAAWALAGLFGVGRATLEGSIFPGLDLGDDPGLLL